MLHSSVYTTGLWSAFDASAFLPLLMLFNHAIYLNYLYKTSYFTNFDVE